MSADTLPDRFAEFLEAACRWESVIRGPHEFSHEEYMQAAQALQATGGNFTSIEYPLALGAVAGMWATYALDDEDLIHFDEIIDQAKAAMTTLVQGS
jgi:hypothetical protein